MWIMIWKVVNRCPCGSKINRTNGKVSHTRSSLKKIYGRNGFAFEADLHWSLRSIKAHHMKRTAPNWSIDWWKRRPDFWKRRSQHWKLPTAKLCWKQAKWWLASAKMEKWARRCCKRKKAMRVKQPMDSVRWTFRFCPTKIQRSTSWAQRLRVSHCTNIEPNRNLHQSIDVLFADFSLNESDAVTSIEFHALALVKSTLGASNLYEIVLKSIERNFAIVEQNVHSVNKPLKTFVFYPKEIGHLISFVYPTTKENDGRACHFTNMYLMLNTHSHFIHLQTMIKFRNENWRM